MELTYSYNDQLLILRIEKEDDGWRVHLPSGAERLVGVDRLADDVLQIAVGDRVIRVPVARTPKGVEVSFGGQSYFFTHAERGSKPPRRAHSTGEMLAPMPGVVAAILVEAGQSVTAHQPLAVVEAMKVMATVEAPFAGRVKAVHAKTGDQVVQDQPLIDIELETKA